MRSARGCRESPVLLLNERFRFVRAAGRGCAPRRGERAGQEQLRKARRSALLAKAAFDNLIGYDFTGKWVVHVHAWATCVAAFHRVKRHRGGRRPACQTLRGFNVHYLNEIFMQLFFHRRAPDTAMDTDGAGALGRASGNNENSGSFRANAEHAGAVESAQEERDRCRTRGEIFGLRADRLSRERRLDGWSNPW